MSIRKLFINSFGIACALLFGMPSVYAGNQRAYREGQLRTAHAIAMSSWLAGEIGQVLPKPAKTALLVSGSMLAIGCLLAPYALMANGLIHAVTHTHAVVKGVGIAAGATLLALSASDSKGSCFVKKMLSGGLFCYGAKKAIMDGSRVSRALGIAGLCVSSCLGLGEYLLSRNDKKMKRPVALDDASYKQLNG